MSGERSERVNRQEASRLQVEVNALRQRIERNDAELIQARRDNLRLSEQISIQESEVRNKYFSYLHFPVPKPPKRNMKLEFKCILHE